MAAITNLDEVKNKLYELFNEAVERHARYEDPEQGGTSYPFGPKTQNRIAIGVIAQGIADVEREQREARENDRFYRLPGK